MVDRFWLRDGASLTLSEDGFLPDPEVEVAPGWLRDAPSSPEIEAIPCLILLGEAGIGKTAALEQQYRRLTRSAARHDRALYVDLSATAGPSAMRSAIFRAEVWERWRVGAGRLHLFLDSLDGSALGVGAVGELLRQELADVPWDRLCLRIACRTADRCRSLESWLHRHVGPDRFGVYQLLPLRRRDARALVARRLPEPDEWIEGVVEADLGPLAASPLTLRMLLDIAAAGRGLPASRTAVYEAACQLAWGERAESRRAGRRQLAIAERIAGELILTGGVSVPADNGVRLPARSEAEFLCARYLALSGASPQAIDRLIFAETDAGPRVIPQLREVAASLGSQSPEFASRLLEHDPQVLLRADPTTWGRADRSALVQALLVGVASHRVDRSEPFVRWRLPGLCDAALANELRRVLNDPPPGAAVRETVADLAGACRLRPLEDGLVALAHDASAPPSVRAAAVGALSRFASDEARRRLIPLAIEPPEDDVGDAIRGTALMATWPSVLALERLLLSLTPPAAESARGAYGDFLRLHMVQGLRDDQLAAAMAWVAGLQRDRRASVTGLVELRDALLVRSASHLDDDGVLAAHADVAACVIGDGEDLVSGEAHAREAGLLGDAATRRRLLARLITHHTVRPAALAASAPKLARPEDLAWATRRHLERIGTPDEERWAELVDALLAGRRDQELGLEAPPHTPAIDSPTGDGRRTAVGDVEPFPPRERTRDEVRRPQGGRRFDVRSRVATAIALWGDGELDGFWATLAWLEAVDGRADAVATSDPRQLAGWSLVDADVHDWVVAAAPRYLRMASARPHEWFVNHLISEPARAGYRALRLLREEDPQSLAALPDAVWARWAAIIVDWPRDGAAEKAFNDWAIAELVERAPDAAAQCLDTALSRDLKDGHGVESVRRFAGALSGPLERIVLKHARSRWTPWRDCAELIDVLLSEGSEAGWQRARRLVAPRGLRSQRELTVAVASRLAARAPDAEWRRLWRLMRSDAEFGRRLIPVLAAERARPVADRLNELQLAELFAWIRVYVARDSRAIALWSDRLLETLVARGSDDAVVAFDHLTRAFPELLAVHEMRAQAAEAARRPVWNPAHPAELVSMVDAGTQRPPNARRRIVSLAGLGLALLLACLVVVSVAPAARAIVAFAVLFTLPGAAILTVVGVGNPLTALATAVALSLTVETAVALVMIWTGWWHPGAAAAAIIAVSCAIFARDLYSGVTAQRRVGGESRGDLVSHWRSDQVKTARDRATTS